MKANNWASEKNNRHDFCDKFNLSDLRMHCVEKGYGCKTPVSCILNGLSILLYTTMCDILELAVIIAPGFTTTIKDIGFTSNENIWHTLSKGTKANACFYVP